MALRYLEVKQMIINIIEGQKPDSKLPSRTWLCRQLDAARNTVDKAIAELKKEGFLYSVKGSGTYIAEQGVMKRLLNIGVLLPSIMEDFYPKFIGGIQKFTSDYNANIILCSSDNSPERQRSNVQRMIELKADGCIIIPTINSQYSFDTFSNLKKNGIPFIFCNRFVDGLDTPFLGCNNYYGAYIATKHLVRCGCVSITYMAQRKYSTSIERFYGFVTAMLDLQMGIPEAHILHDNFAEEELKKRIGSIFDRPDHPDGVVCFDDTMAAVLYHVLAEKHLEAGKDVKIVGYDDGIICESMPVTLSSVSPNAEKMGQEAAGILFGLISGEGVKNGFSLIEPELKPRDSSKADSL